MSILRCARPTKGRRIGACLGENSADFCAASGGALSGMSGAGFQSSGLGLWVCRPVPVMQGMLGMPAFVDEISKS